MLVCQQRVLHKCYAVDSVYMLLVLLQLRLLDHSLVTFCFQLRQQLYKSQCRSVGLSVGPQRVLQKCYALNSVFMLFLLLQFRILEHFGVIFKFLAAIAAQQVTMSVLNKFDTSYSFHLRVLQLLCSVSLMLFLQNRIFHSCYIAYNTCQLQFCIKKLSITLVHTSFVNCNSAYKSQRS